MFSQPFTACSDDDPETIRDGEIDGVYWGKLDVDAAGVIEVNDITQKVYISKTGENQIKMELRNFSFQTLNLGTIAVEQISVQKMVIVILLQVVRILHY